MARFRLLVAPIVIAIAASACGNADSTTDLSPAATAGRDVYRSKGCASCHGSDGAGQVGPALTGLIGSEVQIQDGPPVVADRDYLIESIVDPRAKVVEGYRLPMPTTELTEAELDAVIAFIEELVLPEGDS